MVPGAHFALHPWEERRTDRRWMWAGVRPPTLRSVKATLARRAVLADHARMEELLLGWPWWVPGVATLATLAAVLATLVQRHVLFHPTTAVAWAALALLPCVLDAVGVPLNRLLFAAVVLAGGLGLMVNGPAVFDLSPFVLVLMVMEMGAVATLPQGVVAVGATMVGMYVVDVLGYYSGAPIWMLGVAVAFGGGYTVQTTMRLLQELRRAQAGLEEKAASDERRRIAREVHDVIAHSLSVTMLHLTGARHVLETHGDVEEAVGALKEAEDLGRRAMGDIRRTVGLFGPDGGGERAPMPGAGDLPQLVETFCAAGLHVTYEPSGDPNRVAPETGLGLYRITQESLANVAKHAPGAVAVVSADFAADPLRLVIRNGRANGAPPIDPGEHGGLGLPGMAERARLLGGTVHAGPDGEGWRVDVAVPGQGSAG